MSAISITIAQYRAGAIDRPTLIETLAAFPYKTPVRYRDRPRDPAALWTFIEEADYDDDGTWDELSNAEARGEIARADYLAISRAIDARQPTE